MICIYVCMCIYRYRYIHIYMCVYVRVPCVGDELQPGEVELYYGPCVAILGIWSPCSDSAWNNIEKDGEQLSFS